MDRLKQLKNKNARLKQESDLLKKWQRYLAKQHQRDLVSDTFVIGRVFPAVDTMPGLSESLLSERKKALSFLSRFGRHIVKTAKPTVVHAYIIT